MVPAKSLGTDGINQCGSVRSSARCRYSAGIAGWHTYIPALNRDLLLLLRGTIVNRTYGTHKDLYIALFLLTIFGPVY